MGWGSKATQFHGSAGKQAAQEGNSNETQDDPRGPAVPDDDGLPHITWRGDASIFAISMLESAHVGRVTADSENHRILRTYSKTGSLLATSEPTSRGVSHALAFKPSGILMATTQRYGGDYAKTLEGTEDGSHTVSFFERNGLPKGHFVLQDRGCETIVRSLAWNSDGSLLSVWLRVAKHSDVVQLWSVNNYHWYLKQEFDQPTLASVRWHPENRHELLMAHQSGEVDRRTLVLDAAVSGDQASCSAVIDGKRLLLTPFRYQNVPPPMASLTLDLPAVPVSTSWSDAGRTSFLTVLYALGRVQVWALRWSKSGSLPVPSVWADIQIDSSVNFEARQVASIVSKGEGDDYSAQFALLGSEDGRSDTVKLVDLRIDDGVVKSKAEDDAPVAIKSTGLKSVLIADNAASGFVLHTADGQLKWVAVDQIASNLVSNIGHFFPWLVSSTMKATTGQEESVVVGLTENGLLAAGDKTLARDATSFVVTKTHVIWTTTAHEARFLALASLNDPSAAPQTETLSRRVERGSRIVCAVPPSMSLVLQMPRGNLETICPRPLVLERVRKDLDERRYRRALTTCRTHRIDLNLLHDHDSEALLAHMEDFVDLVDNAEYMELFLSNLRDEDVTSTLYPVGPAPKEKVVRPGKVNRVCDSIRSVLDRKQSDGHVYINTILTTFVRKTPPDYEGALALLKKLKEQDAPLADEACKYVIFLTDADRLFDAALGTYDFTLPLLVAQHSPRRDPREYLPLLRELRSVEPIEKQRFRIDDHLERRAKALIWLLKGAQKHEASMFLPEALTYLRKHTLYWDALEFISKDGKQDALSTTIQLHCAEWLLDQAKEYEQAAILFCSVRKWGKAIEAYIAAGQWRLAMTLASSQPKATIEGVARRAIEKLRADQRYSEAATLSLEYLTNEVDDTVDLLLLARDWAGATRCAASRDRADLVQTVIWPAAAEAAADLIEEVHNDVAIQFSKQIERLAELRRKKREQPQDFYPAGYNDAGADDSASVMTGTSAGGSAFSTFTRYTAIASSFSASVSDSPSSSSSAGGSASVRKKLKKKEEKAKHTGKKGSIYEEDYLFTSLAKLVGEHRWGRIAGEARALVVCLAFASKTSGSVKHAEAAKKLQHTLESFEVNAKARLEELYKAVAAEEEQLEADRLEAIEQAFELGLSPDEMKRKKLFAPIISRKPIMLYPSSSEGATASAKDTESWKIESLHLLLSQPHQA